jgi:putative DNA-invertase from lambdoid prophage Rac
LSKERQRIGIEKAKKEGKYKGRKSKLNPLLELDIKEQLQTRKSFSQIARDLQISRESLYRFMKKMNIDYVSLKNINRTI